MGRIGGRTVVVFTTAIKITGHVAGGNPDMPQQRNHGVSKVLANPFAAHDGIVDGRIDTCRPGNVFEVVEESLVDLVDEHKRVVAPGYAELRSQQGQRRSLDGKGAGKKHFPEVASFDQFVESSPRVGSKEAWYIRQRLLLDDGFGDEDKLGMFARNVKVLDVVALVVPIAEDAATRTHGERKSEAMLVGIGTGVHARLHDALADGLRVAIAREVPDGVEIHVRVVLPLSYVASADWIEY